MTRTSLTDAFDLECPIVSAGLAFAGRPPLAAAVSNAGGMGFLGADLVPAWTVVDMIQATRRLTMRPFGVAFVGAFVTDDQIRACLAVPPAAVALLGPPPMPPWLEELRSRDIDVWLQVTSPAEARLAVRSGANAVIVQGSETRGYPSSAGLVTLLPAVARAAAPLPVIASGGIADGRHLAAVLMLGADAAWCGTRFLASEEARVWQERFRPGAGESGITPVCAQCPSRKRCRTPPANASDSAAYPADVRHSVVGDRTGVGMVGCNDAIGSFDLAALLPTPDIRSSATAFWSPLPYADDRWEIKSAAEIIREMSDEADAVLEGVLSAITR